MLSTNLLNLFRLRIIRLDPSFLDLINNPDTNVLFSVTFALGTMFLLLSNAISFYKINSSSCEIGNANLELDFGVPARSSFGPFSIISRIILSLAPFSHIAKWFLRFPPLKFWISFFRIGIISCWRLWNSGWTYLIAHKSLLWYCDRWYPCRCLDNCCNFWFHCCCCTPCFDF